jgi:hypothetical protein
MSLAPPFQVVRFSEVVARDHGKAVVNAEGEERHPFARRNRTTKPRHLESVDPRAAEQFTARVAPVERGIGAEEAYRVPSSSTKPTVRGPSMPWRWLFVTGNNTLSGGSSLPSQITLVVPEPPLSSGPSMRGAVTQGLTSSTWKPPLALQLPVRNVRKRGLRRFRVETG